MNILESKLTSKERNALPDNLFGLPDERRYPLNDKERVTKAIQFFSYCTPSKKGILAANINKMAKKFNMKLNINKNSPFYKYADKNIMEESLMDIKDNFYELKILANNINNLKDFPSNIKLLFNELINKKIMSEEEMIKFENDIGNRIIPNLRDSFESGIYSNCDLVNPIKIINEIMEKQYIIFYNFMSDYDQTTEDKNNRLFISVIKDICFIIRNKIENYDKDIKNYITIVEDLTNQMNCNLHFVERMLEEQIFNCSIKIFLSKSSFLNFEEFIYKRDNLISLRDELRNLTIRILKNVPNVKSIYNSTHITETLFSANMNFINTENHLNTLKNELKNQINIILLSCKLNLDEDNKSFFLKDVPKENYEIFNIINSLSDLIISDSIKYYNKNYSLILDSKDLLFFSKLKEYFKDIYPINSSIGETIYLGVDRSSLYLLGKDNVENKYLLVKLFDKISFKAEMNFTYTPELITKLTKIKIIKIVPKALNLPTKTILTEGISIDDDGNIKFEIKPKKSYMDEYAENHKLLVENYKNKNYEAMKTNLAFLFALINSIERDVIYNKKDNISEAKTKDAQKARGFAINDFKTYIKFIYKNEPNFDFSEYYKESDYGKLVVNIPHNTILGIKKLFKTIMLP